MSNLKLFHYATIILISATAHVVTWLLFNGTNSGDELRYLDQATRLLNGQELYQMKRIVNPPLLPFILATAQRLGIPDSLLPILSISAVIIATILVLRLISTVVKPFWAVCLSLFLPLHPAVLAYGSQILSEPYCILFAACLVYSIHKLFHQKNNSYIYIIPLSLAGAALAMMKPLFGYTITVTLIASLFFSFFLLKKHATFLRTVSVANTISLVLCLPFLFYTYSETGKYFKWSTGTGIHLLSMSINGENLWGSWITEKKPWLFESPTLEEAGVPQVIVALRESSYVEKDIVLQKMAIENLKENPSHYLVNVIANTGRVLFNYPHSYRYQSLGTYGYILPNMILYLLVAVSLGLLVPTIRYQQPANLWVFCFFLVYIGGNILSGSAAKHGLPLIGPILFWLAVQYRVYCDIGLLNVSFKNRTS